MKLRRSTISPYLKPQLSFQQRLWRLTLWLYATLWPYITKRLRLGARVRSLTYYRIHNPRSVALFAMRAFLWLLLISTANVAFTQRSLEPLNVAAARQPVASATPQSSPAAAIKTLPAGPTGLLLPPGSMAPMGTYRNVYARGQCTWYVAGRRQVPDNWGNANTWYSRAARSGWSVGTTPAIAAIAVTSAGYYGHVALVEVIVGDQVLISEMNYLGPYKYDHRWVSARSFRYIY